jgi:magnesium transporter
MALGEVSSDDQFKLCLRELSKGLINGVSVGIIAAFPVYFVTHSLGIALIIIISLILNMGLACLLGALIPLLLRRFNLDPAQSSSIFLTAVSDVAGFFIFLSLGTWLLL